MDDFESRGVARRGYDDWPTDTRLVLGFINRPPYHRTQRNRLSSLEGLEDQNVDCIGWGVGFWLDCTRTWTFRRSPRTCRSDAVMAGHANRIWKRAAP